MPQNTVCGARYSAKGGCFTGDHHSLCQLALLPIIGSCISQTSASLCCPEDHYVPPKYARGLAPPKNYITGNKDSLCFAVFLYILGSNVTCSSMGVETEFGLGTVGIYNPPGPDVGGLQDAYLEGTFATSMILALCACAGARTFSPLDHQLFATSFVLQTW
jgi:hypothetical protein